MNRVNNQSSTNQELANPQIDYQTTNFSSANRTVQYNEISEQKSDISHGRPKSNATKKTGKEKLLDHDDLRRTILVLRAANHTFRQKILELLGQHSSMTVTELYLKLRVAQSAASQHLGVLRKAGIVITEKKGKYTYYSLNKRRISYISELTAIMAN